MTVLVTGAGIVGSNTARVLAESGRSCVLLDVRPDEAAIRSVTGNSGVQVVQGDIVDKDLLPVLIARHRIDSIIHTAAMLNFGIALDPRRGLDVNLMGTVNVLEAARLHKLRRVVLSSSTTLAYPAFGEGETGPLDEDVSLRLVSQRPMSLYSATKLTNENIMLLYVSQFGIDAVAVRYAAVLGDWAGPNNSIPGALIRTFARAIRKKTPAVFTEPRLVWLGGEEFIDARDCGAANVAALDAPNPVQRVYSITSGQLHSFADFVAAARTIDPGFKTEMSFEPKAGFAGSPVIRKYPTDNSAAVRELGFRPKHDLAATFATYVR